jgi:hypothetical protein
MPEREDMMQNLDGCQIPCLPKVARGAADFGPQPWKLRLKRSLARPWNYHVKKWLKRYSPYFFKLETRLQPAQDAPSASQVITPAAPLVAGDWVRVRSREEIQATLDRWQELKGCAFLDNMWEYCDTAQRVLQPMERFLDERDYKVKKCRGIVLLEGVICRGTPVFGQCDRCCHLFWREEWLEKIDTLRLVD